MKTVLKIVYIAVVLVASVIMYFGFYSSFASSNYTNLLNKAIKTADQTKDYDDIARAFSIFSTPLEDEPVLVESTKENENVTFIYESVNRHTVEYTSDDGKVTVDKIDKVYLITILHPTFQRMNTSNTNQAAFRFYGDGTKENAYYDYLFTLTSKVNADKYVKKPTSEKESVLKGERTLLNTYKDYDLIFFPLTETTAGFIEESIGSITGINVVDNSGSTIYGNDKVALEMDFASEFYTDLSGFVTNYNIYLDNKSGAREIDSETLNTATEYINGFTSDPETYVANFNTKYIQGYKYGDVYTGSKMVVKTLGIILLFLVAATLVYIAIFHIKRIKKFISRFSSKVEEPKRVVPNRAPQQQVVITKSKAAKSLAEETKVVDAKPEETKVEEKVEETKTEEALEETTADVVESPAKENVSEETPVETLTKEETPTKEKENN